MYGIADSPIRPFKRIGKILQQDPKLLSELASLRYKAPDSDCYYIAHHRRTIMQTDCNSRETCIEEMYFDGNDFIKPVTIINEGKNTFN